jgi:hypothetical protein
MSALGSLAAWDAGAAGIATVTDVINQGYRTPPGAGELPVAPADELVPSEALRTGADSAIEVKFVDGSELSVEALSEVVLSDYVFDPQVAASTGIINLNVGLFRFSSADLPDSGLQLKTPVATIGIRGTEFLVHVDGTEATVVDILSGAVEAIPHGKGQPITCIAGQSILVLGPDQDALCGDLGSFTTAVGTRDDNDRPEPGHGGQNRQEKEKPAPDPEPSPDPDQDNEGGGSGGPITFVDEELEWDVG